MVVDQTTGEIASSYSSADELDGQTYVKCRNRRSSECPSCSQEYKGDAWHLLAYGLAGGKGIRADVADRPCTFATLTAPSFGPVWDHVDLCGDPKSVPPVPPHVRVWRSVRAGGDTKTRLSRRTIGLPTQCVLALERHRERMKAAGLCAEDGLVFCTSTGGALDSANVRRSFRSLCAKAGLDGSEWTPRELRHSFVSLMSDAGVPLEDIARLVGHGSTTVTETVYRKQLRPVLTSGTQVMDTLFDLTPREPEDDASKS